MQCSPLHRVCKKGHLLPRNHRQYGHAMKVFRRPLLPTSVPVQKMSSFAHCSPVV